MGAEAVRETDNQVDCTLAMVRIPAGALRLEQLWGYGLRSPVNRKIQRFYSEKKK